MQGVVLHRKKTLFHFILFYCILHMLTVDCGELLRYFPQLDKQEGWITYPSHENGKTGENAGNCC
jgi:hypothetical protein